MSVNLAGGWFEDADWAGYGYRTYVLDYASVSRPRWEAMWVNGFEEIKRLLGSSAMSVRLKYSATTTDADPGAGYLRLNHASPVSATTAYVDLADVAGADITALIDLFGASTSALKGFLTISKVGSSTAWWRYTVSAVGTAAGYRKVMIGHIANGGGTVVEGDELLLSYVPKGDKGDTGPPSVIVSSSPPASFGANPEAGSSQDAARSDHIHQYPEQVIVIAISDETTVLTAGAAKVTWRAPYALTLTQVPRAHVNTASSSGLVTIDINESGSSVLGAAKLSIDAAEKSSTTAATATTLADTAIADDAEITIDVDAAGTGAKGLKVAMYYRRSS